MAKRRRSRYRILLQFEIRQLRLALHLDIPAAAAVLGEPDSLVRTQEEAGRDADKTFVEETATRYITYAREQAVQGAYPPMVISSTTSLYRLRQGLGLSTTDAGRILLLHPAAVEDLESAYRAFPDHVRHVAWATYSDWACRTLRRHDRQAALRPKRATPTKPKPALGLDSSELARMQALAYERPMTAAEAEAEALRLLGS